MCSDVERREVKSAVILAEYVGLIMIDVLDVHCSFSSIYIQTKSSQTWAWNTYPPDLHIELVSKATPTPL